MKLALSALLALTLPSAFTAPTEEAVARAVERPRSADLATRLRDVTDPFVGAPYALSALGEGKPPDADPTLRFDAFDCTTFVETAMALALARDLLEARALLDHLRYRGGVVEYLERRHLPEAEWIPELTKLGFLQDITRSVGGDEVRVESKQLDAKVWHRARHKGMPTLPDARIPAGTFVLDVWPLEKARAGASKIPPGTILNVVRVDFSSVPVRVSHQGLVLEKNGALFLRHAADRMHHSVVDEPLDRFLSRMEKYGKWPVSGVHLTRFAEPPMWRAAVQRR